MKLLASASTVQTTQCLREETTDTVELNSINITSSPFEDFLELKGLP
jgi:hypothetical protein